MESKYDFILRLGISKSVREKIIFFAEQAGGRYINKNGERCIYLDFCNNKIKDKVFSFAENIGVQIQNKLDRFWIHSDILQKVENCLKKENLQIYYINSWNRDGYTGLEYFLRKKSPCNNPFLLRKSIEDILSGTSLIYELGD